MGFDFSNNNHLHEPDVNSVGSLEYQTVMVNKILIDMHEHIHENKIIDYSCGTDILKKMFKYNESNNGIDVNSDFISHSDARTVFYIYYLLYKVNHEYGDVITSLMSHFNPSYNYKNWIYLNCAYSPESFVIKSQEEQGAATYIDFNELGFILRMTYQLYKTGMEQKIRLQHERIKITGNAICYPEPDAVKRQRKYWLDTIFGWFYNYKNICQYFTLHNTTIELIVASLGLNPYHPRLISDEFINGDLYKQLTIITGILID